MVSLPGAMLAVAFVAHTSEIAVDTAASSRITMFDDAEEADRRLRAKFQTILNLGHTCQGMWAFREPYKIRFGVVFGDGWKRCLAMEPVIQPPKNDWRYFWCLYSDYHDVWL